MRILIDGNAMGHAHHNSTVLNNATMQTQAIYGFTRMLRDMKASAPQSDMMVLWDGRAQFRYDLYEDYKSNRDTKEDPVKEKHRQAYRDQVPYIKAMCKALGVKQVFSPELEADDLAGYFCNRWKGQKILLVTGDHDWMQLVSEDVSWLDPRKEGMRCTHENFVDVTGYHTPAEFLDGKCLQGDGSDTIKGVGGLGEGKAPLFLAKWRSVQAFWDAVDSGAYIPAKRKSKTAKTPHPEEALASDEGRAIFKRNMVLMNLLHKPQAPNPATLKIDRDECNPELARRLCERLSFLSILNNWDQWVIPFQKAEAIA